jgi:hypothetical protein
MAYFSSMAEKKILSTEGRRLFVGNSDADNADSDEFFQSNLNLAEIFFSSSQVFSPLLFFFFFILFYRFFFTLYLMYFSTE